MVNKDEQLNVKICDADKKIIERGAELNNENLSSFVRRSALKKAQLILNQEVQPINS